MKVRVHWVPADQGGRTTLPTGNTYSTVARFPEDTHWPEEAWSIVLESVPSPAEQGSPSIGKVRFLVDEAPQERLRIGRSFDLYEGARRVATVEVLGTA